MQPGFFDQEDRLTKLETLGDPPPRLDSIADWSTFRPSLKVIHQKQRQRNAGCKPHDVTLMLKMLVLQALYNLSDDQTEFQVRTRVEHVFGDQRTRQGNILVRTKGKVRAAVKIGLMNLTYNMRRLEFLLRPQSACYTG
jgi:hypothetical protein